MMELLTSVYRELKPGGWVLLIIFAVATAGWIRALWWFLRGRHVTESHRDRLEEWLREKSADALRDPGTIGQHVPASEFLREFVVRAVQIETAPDHRDGGRLDREIQAIKRDVRGRIRFVKICAAVLPLLGLFGTLLGIIRSFDVLAVYGTGQFQLLSEGIAQALLTTQAGLLLAIPLLFVYRYMTSTMDKFVENLTLIGHQIQESVECR